MEPSLFKLLALLTIVATVRQYRALASESLVMLDCKHHSFQVGSIDSNELISYHIRVADRLHQLAASIVGPRGEPSEQGRGRHAEESRDRRQLVLADHAHLHARTIRETNVPEDQHRRQYTDHVQERYTQHTCPQFLFFLSLFFSTHSKLRKLRNVILSSSKIWILRFFFSFFFFLFLEIHHEERILDFIRTQASFPRLKSDRVLSLVLPRIPVLQIPQVLQVVTLQVEFDLGSE